MRESKISVLPDCNDLFSGVARSKVGPIMCLLVFLLGAAWASPAVAQENNTNTPTLTQPPPAPQRRHQAPRAPSLDDRVKAFAASLDLSQTQQLAVKKILERSQLETLQIRQDTSIEGGERIGRLRALQDETVQRIRAVLTEDQKKKYDPLAIRKLAPKQSDQEIKTPHQN